MIYTENHAGGGKKAHITVETAARRIALDDDVYLGYRLAGCDGKHTGMEDEIMERAREMYDQQILRGD